MKEIWSLKVLDKKQIQELSIWTFDMNKHAIVYPKPIFWLIKKNINLVNDKGELLEYQTLNKALDALSDIKRKSQGFNLKSIYD